MKENLTSNLYIFILILSILNVLLNTCLLKVE